MSAELSIAAHENDIGEVAILEKVAIVLTEATLGYLEAVDRRLSAYVDRVSDDADLRVECQFVVG